MKKHKSEAIAFICYIRISYSTEAARWRAFRAALELVSKVPSITGDSAEGTFSAVRVKTLCHLIERKDIP